MSSEDLILWLVTAMSLTAVVFIVWTFAALIRSSFSAPMGIGPSSGRGLSAATRYPGSD